VKEYGTEQIRNVVILGHGGVGKTIVSEALLYSSGAITRMGSIDDGNTASDSQPSEIERKSSILQSLLFVEHKNNKINLLDTPGYADFVGEVVSAIRVADAGLMVVSAQSAVEVGTQRNWDNLDGKPCIFLVNKMDRENADFDKAVSELSDAFGTGVAPVAIPIGSSENFSGAVDLLSHKAYEFEPGGKGKGKAIDIPADMEDKITEYRLKLMEAVAESNDALLEKYFENGELTEEELTNGISNAVARGNLFPVMPFSATQNICSDLVMNIIVDLLPPPNYLGEVKGYATPEDEELSVTRKIDSSEPTSALVFKVFTEEHVGKLTYLKVYSGSMETGQDLYNPNQNASERMGTMYVFRGKERFEVKKMSAGDIGATVKLKNTGISDTLCDKNSQIVYPQVDFPNPVIDIAVEPKQKGEEDKIATGLARLTSEEPTFTYLVDSELKQTILKGQGELQIELIVSKLKEQFGVEVELIKPKIKYRESIKKSAEGHGRHKKQTGGRGQFGEVYIRLEPKPRGEGYEFLNEIAGGVVPNKFIPAVDKGIQEIMEEGVLAGYKVVDVAAALYDGSYHTVDSSEMAFKVAAHTGFKTAFMKANPFLLEPIDDVEIIIPKEFTGDVTGDISSRRGKISGMEPAGNFTKIKARIPQAELYKYSTTLRSLTQGRGFFSRDFSHYEEMPHEFAQKVIDESKKEEE